jgi:ABC-type amino acid transport substrate-binding protein
MQIRDSYFAWSRTNGMVFLARALSILFLTLSCNALLAAEPLIVAVNNNDRPFCWSNERGELTGFSVDIARALCRAMESECRFVATNFADFLPGVVEKRFDFVVANVLWTPEREAIVDFTNRFWRSSSMFVGKPGTIAETSTHALTGKIVGVQKGSVQEKHLHEHYSDTVLTISFSTNTERNTALVLGKVDLIFGSTVSLYAFLTTKEGGRFDFVGSPIDGQGLGGDVAIPLAKGRDDLRKRLNSAIDKILHDGTFARINNTYFSASVF